MKEKINNFLNRTGILPRYTEVSLFLTAITVLLIIFTADSVSRRDFLNRWLGDGDGRMLIAFGMIIAGMIFSIYYAFSIKPMSRTGKSFLLFFAVFANALAGITAGEYALKNSTGIFTIFPILNIISAFILLFLFRSGFINTSSILERQAKKFEIIAGSIIVICLFFISQYIFHNFWAITFSFCVFYATNINEIVYNAFKIIKIYKKYMLKYENKKRN